MAVTLFSMKEFNDHLKYIANWNYFIFSFTDWNWCSSFVLSREVLYSIFLLWKLQFLPAHIFMLKGNNNFSALFYVVRWSVCWWHWPWLWRRGADPVPPWALAHPNSHVHVPPGGQHPPHQPTHCCVQQHLSVCQCHLPPGVDVSEVSGEFSLQIINTCETVLI